MKYYWSCWYTKPFLIEHGAVGMHGAYYWLSGKLIPQHNPESTDFCFMAEDGFDTYLKLISGKTAAEITAEHYDAIANNHKISMKIESIEAKRLHACSLDF